MRARGSPEIRWNDDDVAVPNEVSIRDVTFTDTERGKLIDWKLVLVSATPSGETFCVGLRVDEHRSGEDRYGTQDATTYADCRGGWPGVP